MESISRRAKENLESGGSSVNASGYHEWRTAFQQVLPTYLTVHVLFAVLTFFSSLFFLKDFSSNALPMRSLLQSWNRWDSGHYTSIATQGYDAAWRTAFFPLFPLLEHVGAFLTHDPFLAGLVLSNITHLLLLIILYQLIREDFGDKQAQRCVLYLSIFPSAFFLVAAYAESLFLCFLLLSFYQIRHGRWLLAGLFGFFACLTRSAGIFLLLPFVYEYLRQHQFSWRKIRLSGLSAVLIPAGLAIYSWYCSAQFGDALAWAHAQDIWHHQMHLPWDTPLLTLKAIKHGPGLLSFQTLHNCLDLVSVLFILTMLALMLIGPLRLRKEHMLYTVYAVPLCLFLLFFPVLGNNPVPLQSMPRYMLEVFPSFAIAGHIGTYRSFHDGYLLISGSLLFLSCSLFLIGHWMI